MRYPFRHPLLATAAAVLAATGALAAQPAAAAPEGGSGGIEAPPADSLAIAREIVRRMLPADQLEGTVQRALSPVGEKEEDEAGTDCGSPPACDEGERKRKETLPPPGTAGPDIRPLTEDLQEAFARAYARQYALPELQEILRFAGTPAGAGMMARWYAMSMDGEIKDGFMNLALANFGVRGEVRDGKVPNAGPENTGDTVQLPGPASPPARTPD